MQDARTMTANVARGSVLTPARFRFTSVLAAWTGLVLAGVVAVCGLLPDTRGGGRAASWWSTGWSVATAAAAVCALWLVQQRRHREPAEGQVWRAFARALYATLAGTMAHALLLSLAVVTGTPTVTHIRLVDGATSLAVCWWAYQGLINWNRYRTRTSDPGDWLNGLSSVFAAIALGNLLLRALHASMTQWPDWQLQLWLAQLGAAVVVLGTGITVARLAGLMRDPRVWVSSVAFAAIAVTPTLIAVMPSGTSGYLRYGLFGLAAAGVGWCARRPAAQVRPHSSSTQSLTAGALFILLVAITVLALHSEVDDFTDHYAVIFAVTAALGVSGRIVHLVTDLAHLAQSRHEAMTDELTDLPNRRALLKNLQQTRDLPRSISLLIVDLDQFKQINDRYGHAIGDRVLQQLSIRFNEAVGSRGLLARLGGDEFAVILSPHGNRWNRSQQSVSAAEDLLAATKQPLCINGRRLHLGASIGIASASGQPLDGVDRLPDGELLRRADAAMYQAKAAGGGIREYDAELAAKAEQRALLTDELCALLGPDALPEAAAGQLIAYYQPQIDAVSDAMTGAEALVRWNHPRLGVLTPDQFLDIVEESGLMAPLTILVLSEAVAWANAQRLAGTPVRVSVNLSTSCLTNPDLIPVLDQLVSASHLPPELLVLEVTETGVMRDPDAALRTLHQIRARGIGISIDDYGTGYSSLTYLNTLPADELKLDRSFLTGLHNDPRTRAIIQTTILLAHELGMRLIAEGVEDLATLNALRDMGCDETQGYLHSRPLPHAHLSEWIAEHVPAPNRYLHVV